MRENIVKDIETYFKNKTLNALGVDRDLYRLLQDNDVMKAIGLMQDRDDEVDNALSEYNPQLHKVMHRPNKDLGNDGVHQTCKLPRNLQAYINEVELFFLLGQPITWKKDSGDEECFGVFKQFLADTRFDSLARKAKRLAGAETESAIVYHLYKETDKETGKEEIRTTPFIVARSEGYRLRPLIDQYGQMKAFAYGYSLRESGKTVAHWDILTPDYTFLCVKSAVGWRVEVQENVTGKINAIYFRQQKAWFGSEVRIERLEELDSKVGDANDYFADPIASATADVIDSLCDPAKPGKLIQLTGSNSRFEYITPPNGSASRDAEMESLNNSILFDTFTPNFDLDKMRGFGTLTGAALKNTFLIGYLKRENRKEIYDALIDRWKNVMVGILRVMHPELKAKFRGLRISFEFSDPFATDRNQYWNSIASLYGAGLVSLETAVQMLALTNAPQEEIDRLHAMKMDEVWTANEAKGESPDKTQTATAEEGVVDENS